MGLEEVILKSIGKVVVAISIISFLLVMFPPTNNLLSTGGEIGNLIIQTADLVWLLIPIGGAAMYYNNNDPKKILIVTIILMAVFYAFLNPEVIGGFKV